jgi:hypothetical protein
MSSTAPLVYLAAPYSHTDPLVRETRHQLIAIAAARLMSGGLHIYSPITHAHPMIQLAQLPTGYEYWEQFDKVMMSKCDSMIVLELSGWENSVGVQCELAEMRRLKKPIYYTKADDADIPTLGAMLNNKLVAARVSLSDDELAEMSRLKETTRQPQFSPPHRDTYFGVFCPSVRGLVVDSYRHETFESAVASVRRLYRNGVDPRVGEFAIGHWKNDTQVGAVCISRHFVDGDSST